MKLLRLAIFVVLSCSTFRTAWAQLVDIHALLDQSKRNYPAIRAKSADVSSASLEVKASASEYIPKLTLQHQYTYGTSNSIAGAFYPNPAVISPAGGIRAENTYVPTWGSYTTSLLEWNVFNFGKITAGVKAAEANLTQAEASYANELFQQQVRVADAYLLALISSKLVLIQDANVERADRFKQIVDAGVSSGMRPGVDSSLAHAEYTRARLQYTEARGNEQSQHLVLAELTGSIPESLPVLDSMNFFTTLPLVADTVQPLPVLNPLLKLYRSRVDAAEAKSVAVKRSFLPSITLVGAAWARGSGISPLDDSFHGGFSDGTHYQVYNYLFGVSTRWNLTDMIPARQRFKSEQYRAVREEEIFNEQSLRISRQSKESAILYETNVERAKMAPVQLAAAQRAYRQAFARYRSGLTDLPTLLQSMLILNRAEVDTAIAYSSSWRALLAVAAAKGDFSLFLKALSN